MGASRSSTAAVAGVVGAVLLLTLLVTWAAIVGPDDVLRGDGPARDPATPITTTPTATDTPGGPLTDRERILENDDDAYPVVRALALLVVLVGIGVLLYLLFRVVRWLIGVWDARPRPDPRPVDVDFEVLAPPEALAREMRRDAPAQRVLLTDGTARNAIVEAWHRFEVQASAAGMERHPWETSSEFTLRMLDLVSVDLSAVSRLAVLYREARFSEHELGESARAAALNALDEIHAGLGRLPAAGPR